jgi:hypothetical protein
MVSVMSFLPLNELPALFPLLFEEKSLKTVCSDSYIQKNRLLNGRAASV